jgi:prepilin-type processing-associated H-X9-DG protein
MVSCLNNLKQLQTCWHLYAVDNNDVLPPNNSVYNLDTGRPLFESVSWCTNLARFDSDPKGIQNGVLFQYNQSLGIYRCPADKSTLETPAGEKLTTPRLRSYNMSQSVNGYPEFDPFISTYIPSFKKFSQIRRPGSDQLLVFLDVHEDSILDALFGMPTKQWWGQARSWWDIPANRHLQGANFSFADGHVEHWRWEVPKEVRVKFAAQDVPFEEAKDFDRVRAGFRQSYAE